MPSDMENLLIQDRTRIYEILAADADLSANQGAELEAALRRLVRDRSPTPEQRALIAELHSRLAELTQQD